VISQQGKKEKKFKNVHIESSQDKEWATHLKISTCYFRQKINAKIT
jgi:hypothetical protein